jgi:hypothetical protein
MIELLHFNQGGGGLSTNSRDFTRELPYAETYLIKKEVLSNT